MKILVAGGGIGGLAVASLLKKYGFDVLLIEKAHKWKNIGYVICLWPNGRKVLKELNLYDYVGQIGQGVEGDYLIGKKGNRIKTLSFKNIIKKFGPALGIERSKLHLALRELAKDVPTRLDTTIEKLTQYQTHVDVKFHDGTWDKFDLVIGADGVHSALREEVFGKNHLDYYNWTVWITWLKEHEMQKGANMMLGNARGFMVYQAPNQKACGLFMLPAHHGAPDKPEERVSLLRDKFKDFGWIMPRVLESLEDPTLIFHDDLTRVNMHKWYKGRVVLIGDAEHALSPLLGMGCSMALEDAYVLAQEIKNSTSKNINEAFQKFAQRRQKRIEMLQKEERKLWRLINIKSSLACWVRNNVIKFIPQSYFVNGIYKILNFSV